MYLDEHSFLLLYKALVRPHLEYANQIWSPLLKKHEIEIENVQRRATKLIPGFRDLSYEERLKKLKLPTLKYRRARGDMIEIYKILSGKYDPEVSNFIKLNKSKHNTRGHMYKIEKEYAKNSIRRNTLIHRSVDLWNNLPAGVVLAKTVMSFERQLDRHWSREPFKFDHTADKPSPTRQPELAPEATPSLHKPEEDL